MKASLVTAVLILAASMAVFTPTTTSAPPSTTLASDEAAIRHIVDGWQRSPEHFKDVDWENAFGTRKKGIVELEQFLEERVRPTMATAERTVLAINVAFVTPDVATADKYWRVVGQTDGVGGPALPERNGRTTYVLHKQRGRWSVLVERIADLRR